MSSLNGKLTTCDRCGEQVFCKYIKDGVTDGGYTRWNKFEEAEGWGYEDRKDLCPKCTDEFKKMKEIFWKTGKLVEV
jgi:hypothetical protein